MPGTLGGLVAGEGLSGGWLPGRDSLPYGTRRV